MKLDAIFLTLGGLFALGLAADLLGRRTKIPRVTLVILLGVIVGPHGLDFLSTAFQELYAFLSTTALTMVAFLLGGVLSMPKLADHGREILSISLTIIMATIVFVAGGFWALGISVPIALMLAGIATATDPAATQDVIRQNGKTGRFSEILLGVVAIDDAWGLIAFSLLLIFAKGIGADTTSVLLMHGLWEIGGALLIGLVVGGPAAYLTGRISGGEPALIEALVIVFLCAGLSIWFEVSYLLAGMTAGAVVVNLAKHHERPFHEIEMVEWPFMFLFFILAGASLDLENLSNLGFIGGAYIILRILGRILGGWIGGRMAGMRPVERRWIGSALMPQAGVAVGMALVASQQFPDWGNTLLSVTIATTIVFEILGPILTMLALQRVEDKTLK